MFKSKGMTLTWMIIYSIISVWVFFASIFAIIAFSRYMPGIHTTVHSTAKSVVQHYFLNGTPVMLLISLVCAWHFYGKKDYEKVWYCAPGIAIAYCATMFIALY